MPHVICRFLPDTTLTFVNEAYCRYWNMSREELIGRKFVELIPEPVRNDVHDDLSQRLALISIDVEQLARGWRPAQQLSRVHDISRRVGEVAFEVHHLSRQLHPSGLEVLGLVGAIEAFCRDVAVQHGVSVCFDHGDVPRDVPSDVSLCLFRIVQEALHNVAKHSGARHASVIIAASVWSGCERG